MILNDFISLPRILFEQSGMSIAELSQRSGIDYNRLNDILTRGKKPTFNDIMLIQETMELTDEMVADILNKTKE